MAIYFLEEFFLLPEIDRFYRFEDFGIEIRLVGGADQRLYIFRKT